jgi:D-glycero-D-manno-heptose 1,7-bisphosphate phosphatase
MNTKKQAIFIDRDGIINEAVDRGENFFVRGKKVRWTAPFSLAEFKLNPHAQEALVELGRLGFLRILVTNQPDVAYGNLSIEEHEKIMAVVGRLPFDGIQICLHGRDEGCECKKPRPGLLLEAAKKWNIDLANSFILGDTAGDMEAGKNIGCRRILLKAKYNSGISHDFLVHDLLEVVGLLAKIR